MSRLSSSVSAFDYHSYDFRNFVLLNLNVWDFIVFGSDHVIDGYLLKIII